MSVCVDKIQRLSVKDIVKGTGGKQWISLPRHNPVSGRKWHGVEVETWLVASIQVRRLQFLCLDGSHNLRTYCSSCLPPTCPPPLLSPQPKHNRPWLPATSGLRSCFSQHLLKWTGWPINRIKCFLIKKTPLSPLSLCMASRTHTAPALTGFNNLSDFDSVGVGVEHGESWTHHTHRSPSQARCSNGWGSLYLMAKKGHPWKCMSLHLAEVRHLLPPVFPWCCESTVLTH